MNEPAKIKIKPSENGTVKDLSTNTSIPLQMDKVSEIEVKNASIVSLDGRIPLILIPVAEGAQEVKINPPTYRETSAGINAQKEISTIVSEVIIGLEDVQKEIQKKNYDQALSKVEEMQKKYPAIGFLHFTRGSVLFLQGKKNKARRAVTTALEAHPNFQEGKDFLKALGGPLGPSEEGKNE